METNYYEEKGYTIVPSNLSIASQIISKKWLYIYIGINQYYTGIHYWKQRIDFVC